MIFRNQVHSLRVAYHIIMNIKNWPKFFWAHFISKKNFIIVYLRNGYRIRVRPCVSDVTMLMESWGMRYYNPKGFEIREGDTVFDIGTHIGSFSLYASTMAKRGRIHSFEPLPENYKILQYNVKNNKIKNIQTNQLAVSSQTGKSVLHLYEGVHTGSSSLYYRNSAKKITIKTTSLKEYVKKYNISKIDFMKIDCEGAEYDILFNLPKNILKIIGKISMEYHDKINEHKHGELMKFFAQNGFKAVLKGEFIYALNET